MQSAGDPPYTTVDDLEQQTLDVKGDGFKPMQTA